jgi:phosphatidylserine/phosphatidylglycerophosphate/cardiolipin synthase-like enzyme
LSYFLNFKITPILLCAVWFIIKVFLISDSPSNCIVWPILFLDLRYQHIYVHSKLMIVDSVFLTLGSANVVDLSMDKDHSELNVSLWSTQKVKFNCSFID